MEQNKKIAIIGGGVLLVGVSAYLLLKPSPENTPQTAPQGSRQVPNSPTQPAPMDTASVIAKAAADITGSVTNFLGIRQQRLQEREEEITERQRLENQIRLGQQDLLRGTEASNNAFLNELIEKRAQRESAWRNPVFFIVLSIVILAGIAGIVMAIKKEA